MRTHWWVASKHHRECRIRAKYTCLATSCNHAHGIADPLGGIIEDPIIIVVDPRGITLGVFTRIYRAAVAGACLQGCGEEGVVGIVRITQLCTWTTSARIIIECIQDHPGHHITIIASIGSARNTIAFRGWVLANLDSTAFSSVTIAGDRTFIIGR